ncbi:MAG: DUF6063 family protein [Promethearchaeota archaeon]
MSNDEELDSQLVEKAAKLIYLGLESPPGLSANREFKDFLREYKNNSSFRNIANAISNGLQLEILDVDNAGIFLRPLPRSVFAMRRSSVKKLVEKGQDRYVGLILIALAAYYFSNDSSFDEESTHFTSPITIHKIDGYIREKCKNIKEKSKPDDVPAGNKILELLLMSYLQLPNESYPGSKSRSTCEYFIRKTLNFLIEQRLFIKKSENYWPTPKFRFQMESMAENDNVKQFLRLKTKQEEI